MKQEFSKSDLSYIYGKHAVYEALLERPDIVTSVYIDTAFNDEKIFRKLQQSPNVVIHALNQNKLPGDLRRDVSHQGVIATIKINKLLVDYKKFIANFEMNQDTAFLVLGEVQDPHNVGAVIRSAAAFGLSGVLIPPHNQAPITGTVVKVSAGMAFRIPLIAIKNVNATLRDLKERGAWVYGLAGGGSTSVYEETFSKPSVFVLGNESTGLRLKTSEVCDSLLSIPIHPRCESLNAAAATAVILSHWNKQHQDMGT
jgi:23S rRNA (guanosine2251-2'-O)-methyltransferase